jgi:transketolase
MTKEHKQEMDTLCLQFRNELVDLLYNAQTGHPGGSLSCLEIVTVLYQEIMHHDPKKPDMEGRDRLILSKGHAAPILYINLAEAGYFPKEELKTFRQINSSLQGHPCVHKTAGVELSTGPLGLGLEPV